MIFQIANIHHARLRQEGTAPQIINISPALDSSRSAHLDLPNSSPLPGEHLM